jgi:hypothetical protein
MFMGRIDKEGGSWGEVRRRGTEEAGKEEKIR